jgi:hypothetical protein
MCVVAGHESFMGAATFTPLREACREVRVTLGRRCLPSDRRCQAEGFGAAQRWLS